MIPEFQSFLLKFDIIGLQETFCDDYDAIELEGYTFILKNRKQHMKRKSGGVAVAYKTYLEQYINHVESDSKLVQWFYLSDRLTKNGKWLCGAVYIPPENSVYAVENPYGEIENEMRNLSVDCSSVLVFGDMNSRSKNLQDFVRPDNEMFENLDMHDLFDELQSELSSFETNRYFRLQRQNSDTGVNNYGYRMIDFCIDNNLLIINGRGNDSSGCVTCKNISTVDYFLSSPSLFSKFESLYVHDFCELLSDSHNPVSLKVNVGKFNIDNYSSCNNMDKTKLWDAEKIQSFLRNFNDDDITNLCRQIDYLKSSGSASQGDINQIVDSLNDMYISNCRSSFGTTSTSSKR